MPDTTTRAREIQAELDKLAPEPVAEPGATARLARYVAAEAQLALARLWTRGAESGPKDALLLGAYYAAARALAKLESAAPGAGDGDALAIVEDWDDGMGAGRWIAAYLGDDAGRIAELAQELAETRPKRAAGAGMVLVDPEDLRVLMRLAEDYASRDPLRLKPADSCGEALDRLAAAAGVTRDLCR